VRAVQQVLFDLKLIKDKPDGAMGPMTRAAIRDFEKSAGLKETGQASKVVYAALLAAAQGKRDTVANSPLPTPPKEAPPKEQPKVEAAKPPEEKKPEEKPISIGNPPPPPPPPSSADIAKMGEADRVLAIQTMLIQLNFYRDKADGKVGPATKAAIRDYERASGLKETGEPTQAVLDSLKEMMGLVKR
jgi:peptidoglycan hydrolase-like protein with peptidoglycan-binding domain